jgi:hypothetical protein
MELTSFVNNRFLAVFVLTGSRNTRLAGDGDWLRGMLALGEGDHSGR